jgi:hypothetical protein
MPEPTTDLVPVDMPALMLIRTPEIVLAEAHRAAVALKDVLDKRQRKVMFNGNRYLEFEDWSTVARFFGVGCKVLGVRYVEYPNGVHGFTAHAEAFRADGVLIASAEADCLTDEPKWRARPKYVTEHGRRVQRGEEPVPMHQLKSMAQTRASVKTLRMALAWVVVLAGYKPTPAEELDDRADDGDDDEPVRDVREDPPTPRGPARGSMPPPFATEPKRDFRTIDTVPERAPVVKPPAPATTAAPAVTPSVTTPALSQIGTIIAVSDVLGPDGAITGALVKLSTGFIAGAKSPDILAGIKTLSEMGVPCELVTRAPSAPGRAPMILEVRSAPKEAGL